MRINVAVPEAYVRPEVLDAALEGVTRLNEALLAEGKVPLWRDALRAGVQWKPERPGDEHFDHAGVVFGRRAGDCDDLAPYHASSLRHTGEDPGATAIVKRSGPNRWHAVVQRSDGSIDDPSADAGMHSYSRAMGVVGAGLPKMFPSEYHPHAYHSHVQGVVGTYIMRPQLAMRPVRSPYGRIPEAWQARADIPWHWSPGDSKTDVAMVSLHASPVSSQAVVGACRGAVALGEANDVDEDTLDRICCIADAATGELDWEDLAEEYGPEHATAAGQLVCGFFGLDKVFKAASSVVSPALNIARSIPGVSTALNVATPLLQKALPIAQMAAPFIPGIGPVASMALQAASPMLQQALQSGALAPPAARPGFAGIMQQAMQRAQQAMPYQPQQYSYPQPQQYAPQPSPFPPGFPYGAFGGRGVSPFG